MVKNSPGIWETWVRSLDQEDPLEEGMTTHSSILAWRIPPWTEKPGGLQSMGLQRVGHSWATKPSTAQEEETLKKMHSLQKMTSRKLGECYHTKGTGGSTGGKKRIQKSGYSLPHVWNSFTSFFPKQAIEAKKYKSEFHRAIFWILKVCESPGVSLKCRFWFSRSVLSWESWFLKAPRWCWCCWSVNHSLSCETIKK